MKGNSGVENGVRLPAKYFNMVPEVGQSLGEVTRVYALSTNVGLATVGEICNA